MDCEPYREALSARLDGEDRPDERELLDAHLAGCPDCRRWSERAAEITRLARLGPVPTPAPGIPEALLTAAPGPGRARLAGALRWLLGGLGAVQILLAVAQLAGSDAMSGAGGMPPAGGTHLLHESAAWNLGVGAGFLVIAWRRTRPAALVPVLGAFVATLTLLSIADLGGGAVALSRLASHLPLLAGYAVTVALSRPGLRPHDPPAGTRTPPGRTAPGRENRTVVGPPARTRWRSRPARPQDRAA